MVISKVKLAVAGVLTAACFGLLGVGAGTAYAEQTHMVNAQNDLGAALNELNAALPDKAGHRVAAINLVNQAITQVNEGIAAGAQ
jgi:hypothetical protein